MPTKLTTQARAGRFKPTRPPSRPGCAPSQSRRTASPMRRRWPPSGPEPSSDRGASSSASCSGAAAWASSTRSATASAARVALKLLRRTRPERLLAFKNEFRALAGRPPPEPGAPRRAVRGRRRAGSSPWSWCEGAASSTRCARAAAARRGAAARGAAAARARAAGAARAGKVHRDVKPRTCWSNRDGRVVLLDFGLVGDAARRAGVDAAPRSSGTAAYMAPEQAAARRVGPAADWYALGVMLYEALTGALPFDGQPPRIVLPRKQRARPRRARGARGRTCPPISTRSARSCSRAIPSGAPDGASAARGSAPTPAPVRRASRRRRAQSAPQLRSSAASRELAALRDGASTQHASRPRAIVVLVSRRVGDGQERARRRVRRRAAQRAERWSSRGPLLRARVRPVQGLRRRDRRARALPRGLEDRRCSGCSPPTPPRWAASFRSWGAPANAPGSRWTEPR